MFTRCLGELEPDAWECDTSLHSNKFAPLLAGESGAGRSVLRCPACLPACLWAQPPPAAATEPLPSLSTLPSPTPPFF